MSSLMTAITCHCRHVLSIPLCECDSIALHHRYIMQFLTSLKDVVGFLDCIQVHIQAIQVAVPQVTQVQLVTCVCSFYKLYGQGYLLCLFMICRYRHPLPCCSAKCCMRAVSGMVTPTSFSTSTCAMKSLWYRSNFMYFPWRNL